MHPYAKWILIAIIVLIVKAFYIDNYLKPVTPESNATAPSAESPAQPEPSKDAAAPVAEKNDTNLTTTQRFRKESEQSVIDRAVEWLADVLAEKLH